MLNTNLTSFLFGPTRRREFRETLRIWRLAERDWNRSPLSRQGTEELAERITAEIDDDHGLTPPIRAAVLEAVHACLLLEHLGELEVDWRIIDSDPIAAMRLRQTLAVRRRWARDTAGTIAAFTCMFRLAAVALQKALPEAGRHDEPSSDAIFEVSLVELIERPAFDVERLVLGPYDEACLAGGLFMWLRQALERNLATASGLPPSASISDQTNRLIMPTRQKGKTAKELVDLYLAGTPFKKLFDVTVPFHAPAELRFEHCHIVGGTGHGKTQLMQRMIHADLLIAQKEERSVIVIDSQGDLISKLVRLALFSPEEPESLYDRLVLIDPADVEFPAALNLFDAHLARLRDYRPVDQERVLNGIIELYEMFFGALLGAELTQKQGVIFKFLARLMLTIPGATIHTLMQLMEDGRPFKQQMTELEGSARYFFETEFFHPSFAATKKQILKRLWGVLSTPAFERMFAQRENKLDLFEAMNESKIILVSTAKDLLKQDGSALFGRFFIAMLAQAALERSTIPLGARTPTFVYVDEAQEYFDDSIETILSQARKYRVGITLAHQTLDQLTPRLRAAINTNTSLKCIGGVSAKDARSLADELHTTSEFIEAMRRGKDRTEFAIWLKQRTPRALRMSVPLGHLERQPILTEEAYEALLAANRARYCGTLDEVLGFSAPEVANPADPPPGRREPIASEPAALTAKEHQSVPAAPIEARPRAPAAPRELGKGGPQHRYVQHLVKGLAEERGFRAVIEEPVYGGQIDVALHRDDLSIACEISITSTAPYEAQNLAKCIQGGFTSVFAIAADEKRLRAIQIAANARLSEGELACVMFLTPMMVGDALDALAPPPDEISVVRGYRVKVSRTVIGADEAGDRRAAVARVIAQSLRGMPKDA